MTRAMITQTKNVSHSGINCSTDQRVALTGWTGLLAECHSMLRHDAAKSDKLAIIKLITTAHTKSGEMIIVYIRRVCRCSISV